MKKFLLDQIDKAIAGIPDQWDFDLDAGKYVFKIPGGTLYKVRDLHKFKKLVLKGFKTHNPYAPKTLSTTSSAIKNFMRDGEIGNAYQMAKMRGENFGIGYPGIFYYPVTDMSVCGRDVFDTGKIIIDRLSGLQLCNTGGQDNTELLCKLLTATIEDNSEYLLNWIENQ